jgi:SH3 domain protein
MKHLLSFLPLVLALLVAAAPTAAQDQRYVTDHLQVTVRTGPSVDNKIIAVVDSGDELEVLTPAQDGWVKVRTPEGKEGWMIERYLQPEPTAALRLEKLDPQNQTLLQQNEELTEANRRLNQALNQAQSRVAELEAAYAQLQKDAADEVQLKREYQRLQEDYQEQSQRLEALSTEVESLRFSNNLKWFLAGAGILVLGWLMGLALGRRRRRTGAGLY